MMKYLKYITLSGLLLAVAIQAQAQCSASDPEGCTIIGPSIVCIGQNVTFSPGCDYSFNTFTWSNGNGGSGSTSTFTTSFSAPGTYCISLSAQCVGPVGGGKEGESDECEIRGDRMSYKMVTVLGQTSGPAILANPGFTVCDPQTIFLNVTDPQEGVTYTWKADNLTIGTGTGISYPFENNAVLKVTASFSGSCDASVTRNITVHKTAIHPVIASESYRITVLSASGGGDPENYFWQTSEGGTSVDRNVEQNYEVNEDGIYYIRLFINNCWPAPTSIQVVVKKDPAPAELGVSKQAGYSLLALTNANKDFLYQHAEYFLVSGTSGTETNRKIPYAGYKITSPGTCFVRGRDIATGTWGEATSAQVTLRGDENINWIHKKSYDGTSETNPFAETKSYFGEDGRSLQTQTKTHPVNGNVVFTTGELRDQYDRTVGATLSSPTSAADFLYHASFLLHEQNGTYPVLNDVKGTPGWYYSPNNTDEPLVAGSDVPYSRMEYYDDGTGEVKRSASAGDIHQLGGGHEQWSGTFPVFNEAVDYLSKRSEVFSGASQTKGLQGRAIQHVARDVNGEFAVSITDKDGRTIMTAQFASSEDKVLEVNNTIVCTVNDVTSRWEYFYLTHAQTVSTVRNEADCFVTNLITGEKVASPNQVLERGFYKIEVFGDGGVEFYYKNYYKNVACQFYDDAGRLVSSVSPNGYATWQNNTPYASIDKTTYVYNHRGWLLSMAEPDAGTTRYQYRKDGKIRFSQNAQQQQNETGSKPNRGRFSYTLYDEAGRPVESGEYVGSTLTFAAANNTLEFNQQVAYAAADKKDWITTAYDYPDDGFASTGLDSLYQQKFVRTAVSKSENANIKTWYSYDELGRVVWMAQKPGALPRIFVVEYKYDFLGNILTVSSLAYDLNGKLQQQFYHHYEYDADKRLSKAYTSLEEAGARRLRATYKYYLHGPLKRIELGDKLQGIDFVYNIQGWLTHINHPDPAQDPGGDSNDVFGMVLDYYESDLSNLFTAAVRTPEQAPWTIHGLPVFARNTIATHQPLIRFNPLAEVDQPGVKDYSAENPVYKQMLMSKQTGSH